LVVGYVGQFVDQGTNNYANTWFEIGFDTNNPGNGLPAAD
jgi:hypothetical protein